ncbi:MAG: DUF885 domain-containing protein [Parachlamydiales bacterium]|nr:DUF885 domain-containing protein [Parachlamydiales bacterium]
MKIFKKIMFTILSIAVLLIAVFSYKLLFGKPLKFNHFVQRVFYKSLLSDPESLTQLGSIDNTIYDFHSNKLTDQSEKHFLKTLKETKRDLKILHSYNYNKLTYQEKISYEILDQYLNDILMLHSFGYGNFLEIFTPYPVNQSFGIQNGLPEFMLVSHQIKNIKSAKHYISRLLKFNKKMDQVIKELELREKNSVILPKFAIEKVLIELKEFISYPPEKHFLYTHLVEKLQTFKNPDEKENEKLKQQALTAIEKSVYPSYEKLIAFLEKEKNIATDEDGVWKFKNGDKFYEFCLKVHTTTDLTPEEIHQIGIKEVYRIQQEMQKILTSLGYTGKSAADLMKDLAKNPKFLFLDSKDPKKEIIETYEKIFADIKDKVPSLFLTLPKKELIIVAIPDFKAKTAPPAYYQSPSMDGKRPGMFFVNTYDINNVTKFTMPTLAYHEGIPGHHFQVTIALELKDIPTLRKVVNFTSYIEGWALYTEQLAFEYNFTDDPYANLGRLQMELFRAVRLVVDTGIHYKKWSRQKAIDYMLENTGMPKADVVAEIERYIVLPGQACSYKIGMMKILELREKMKKELGKNFDIKIFHDIVLKNGALPLTTLEKVIDDEIIRLKKR